MYNNFQWFQNVTNPRRGTSVDDISDTVSDFFDFCEPRCLTQIDDAFNVLSRIHPSFINTEHLAAVLRLTYSKRDQLPSWFSLMGIAQAKCVDEEIPADDLLFGMLTGVDV